MRAVLDARARRRYAVPTRVRRRRRAMARRRPAGSERPITRDRRPLDSPASAPEALMAWAFATYIRAASGTMLSHGVLPDDVGSDASSTTDRSDRGARDAR